MRRTPLALVLLVLAIGRPAGGAQLETPVASPAATPLATPRPRPKRT